MIRKDHPKAERSRRGSFLLFSLCLGLSSLFFSFNLTAGIPRTPDNENEILEKISFSNSKNTEEIRELKNKLRSNPNNVQLAEKLAKAYIAIAREFTDVRYFGYAKAVLKPWWHTVSPPAEALLLRATLHQQEHQYAKASDDLKQLVKRQPRNTQAWLTLSIIQQVQGNYDAAQASCAALARTALTWLATLCYSQVLSFTGAAERAYQTQIIIAKQLASSRPDLRQWVLGISAETALRLGKKTEAEAYFKKALAVPLRDAYLLRVYSDYLLSENKAEEVLTLLQDEVPDTALLLRLAIAAKQMNNKSLSQTYQPLLISRFKAARLRDSNLHERDEALYLLTFTGDLNKALRLARNNWRTQKEPDDALILLRVAMAKQAQADIKTVKVWLDKTQLQDVRITHLLAGVSDE